MTKIRPSETDGHTASIAVVGAASVFIGIIKNNSFGKAKVLLDGVQVTQDYNNQGLPNTLGSYVTASTYTAASQLDTLTFGSGAVTDYTYNAQNLRLTDIDTTKSGAVLQDLHYTYDNVGNVQTITDVFNGQSNTITFGYDDLNRLMSATTTGANPYSRAWTYTPIGNMQTRTISGATSNYSYDANHKHAVSQVGTAFYCYDANGNMTRRNTTTSSCTNGDAMSYDVENRMTSMTTASGTTTLVYNGDGTRVSRQVVGAGTTYYIGNYYEVWVPNSGTTTFNKYYYFGAQRVAAKIASTLFYLQGDHLGSSSVVMTQAGTSFYSRQTYFPYGAQRTTEGSALPTDYTFTGQKSDDSTGLMFYGARYYDTSLGRFTQPDTIVPSPFNPQSLNRFSYTLNNPVRYTDPTGHMEVDPGGGTSGEDDEEHAAEEGEYVITPENVDEYLPPADTGSDQTPDHDDVQEALENPGTYESETQIAVAMFEKGYNPYADERFSSFAEYDQANLIWYFTLWTYQKRQDAGISGGGDDFWALFAAGSAMAAGSLRNSKIPKIQVPMSLYPESAQHILDAQSAGHPNVLTIDRGGINARRAQSLSDYPPMSGLARDEYPPAMFREGGYGASVRYISPSDNSGAGACIGNQCRPYPNGALVEIEVIP